MRQAENNQSKVESWNYKKNCNNWVKFILQGQFNQSPEQKSVLNEFEAQNLWSIRGL